MQNKNRCTQVKLLTTPPPPHLVYDTAERYLRVTTEYMCLYSRAHVPDLTPAVATTSHQQVQIGVEGQRVHPTPVPMVVPDDLQRAENVAWTLQQSERGRGVLVEL